MALQCRAEVVAATSFQTEALGVLKLVTSLLILIALAWLE